MRTSRIAVLLLATMATACTTASKPGQEIAANEAPPPPAPPPPPSPPPPMPGSYAGLSDAEAAVAVTGSRLARQVYEAPSPVTTVGTPEIAQGAAVRGRYAYIPAAPVIADPGRERYDGEDVSPVRLVLQEPVSTFSIDVDTGAYANVRRFLTLGSLPPGDAVRTEELINYFRYDYEQPETRTKPFSVTTEVTQTPWNPETRLLRIGLRGYDLPHAGRPPANLVFLVDVSGSMDSPDKLPLVKAALSGLAEELQPQDRVSIVVYAGAAGVVLEPTNNPGKIRAVLNSLSAGGSTAGGQGLQLAYNIARANMIDGGVNRVILATDGDFNVGVSDTDSLIQMIERERDSGITLTTLGFGTGNYNEALMEQVADHGNGNYAYIDSALEAQKVLSDEMAATLFTIAKDVKIQVEFNPAQVSQYRLIGYENRALREEDFDNDLVDAGDIGAGHQVTAIYEIVPATSRGWIAPRRYEATAMISDRETADEVAFVKLRYKLPDSDNSRLIELAVPGRTLRDAGAPSGDMAFATAVAAYGQKLRGDELLQGYGFTQIAALAGPQNDFLRQEFLRLVEVAQTLDGG